MRIIRTDQSKPEDLQNQWERDQVYNAIDTLATRQSFDSMAAQLDEITAKTYKFSKALQSPALEMRLRGVLVDPIRKAEVIDEFYDKIEILERNLERIVLEGVGMPGFNWRSNADLQTLFYGKLGIPVTKRQGRPTVDRAAREKMETYTIARPILSHINAMAELAKKIS